MLEHAIYSVISPEGAASILWRDTAKAQDAATNMKITAQDMVRFGVIDTVITEPTGGAHRDPAAAIAAAGEAIANALGRTTPARPRNGAPAAAREVPRHGPHPRLARPDYLRRCPGRRNRIVFSRFTLDSPWGYPKPWWCSFALRTNTTMVSGNPMIIEGKS